MEVKENPTVIESINIAEINELIQKESEFVDLINMEVKKVIVGQQHMIEFINWSSFKWPHTSEGVPGLAKTLAISTFPK